MMKLPRRIVLASLLIGISCAGRHLAADEVLLEDTFEFFELGEAWQEHGAGLPDVTLAVGFSDGSEVLQMVTSGFEEDFFGIETVASISLTGLADIRVDARLRPINQGVEGSVAAAEVLLLGASGEFIRAFASNNAGPDPAFMNDWANHYADSYDNYATSGPWAHCTDKGGPACDAMRNLVVTVTATETIVQAFDDNSDPDWPRWETSFDDFTLADLGSSLTLALRQLAVEGGDNVAGFFDSILVSTSGAAGLIGDFNQNGVLDGPDIDDLTGRAAAGTHLPAYDLNGDSLVDTRDVVVWIKDLFGSWIGDANLDGQFDSSDLVDVLASGTYEVDSAAVWTTGDFNGDGRTNSSDLVASLADGGYELGPRPALASVPEPGSATLGTVATLWVLHRRRLR
jgi:hypothetical protein